MRTQEEIENVTKDMIVRYTENFIKVRDRLKSEPMNKINHSMREFRCLFFNVMIDVLGVDKNTRSMVNKVVKFKVNKETKEDMKREFKHKNEAYYKELVDKVRYDFRNVEMIRRLMDSQVAMVYALIALNFNRVIEGVVLYEYLS